MKLQKSTSDDLGAWSSAFSQPYNQRRHHGEDWKGHVFPNIFQDRFFNSSKSEEKYLGGTMVAHEKSSSTDKQGNEKDFQQIHKEMTKTLYCMIYR